MALLDEAHHLVDSLRRDQLAGLQLRPAERFPCACEGCVLDRSNIRIHHTLHRRKTHAFHPGLLIEIVVRLRSHGCSFRLVLHLRVMIDVKPPTRRHVELANRRGVCYDNFDSGLGIPTHRPKSFKVLESRGNNEALATRQRGGKENRPDNRYRLL